MNRAVGLFLEITEASSHVVVVQLVKADRELSDFSS